MDKATDDYISVSDAAVMLGITRQRVLQLIDAGRLEAAKFASVYMIQKASLKAVENRKPGRPPKTENASSSKKLETGVNKESDAAKSAKNPKTTNKAQSI